MTTQIQLRSAPKMGMGASVTDINKVVLPFTSSIDDEGFILQTYNLKPGAYDIRELIVTSEAHKVKQWGLNLLYDGKIEEYESFLFAAMATNARMNSIGRFIYDSAWMTGVSERQVSHAKRMFHDYLAKKFLKLKDSPRKIQAIQEFAIAITEKPCNASDLMIDIERDKGICDQLDELIHYRAQGLDVPKLKLEEDYRIAFISTAHLSEPDRTLLTIERADRLLVRGLSSLNPALRYTNEHSWVIRVDAGESRVEHLSDCVEFGFSDDFINLVKIFQREGFTFVGFDGDAEIVEGLPTFDW